MFALKVAKNCHRGCGGPPTGGHKQRRRAVIWYFSDTSRPSRRLSWSLTRSRSASDSLPIASLRLGLVDLGDEVRYISPAGDDALEGGRGTTTPVNRRSAEASTSSNPCPTDGLERAVFPRSAVKNTTLLVPAARVAVIHASSFPRDATGFRSCIDLVPGTLY